MLQRDPQYIPSLKVYRAERQHFQAISRIWQPWSCALLNTYCHSLELLGLDNAITGVGLLRATLQPLFKIGSCSWLQQKSLESKSDPRPKARNVAPLTFCNVLWLDMAMSVPSSDFYPDSDKAQLLCLLSMCNFLQNSRAVAGTNNAPSKPWVRQPDFEVNSSWMFQHFPWGPQQTDQASWKHFVSASHTFLWKWHFFPKHSCYKLKPSK